MALWLHQRLTIVYGDYMRWKARLAGQPPDVQVLAELFPEGPIAISIDESGQYLCADALDDLDEASAVREAAGQLLLQICAAARTIEASFRGVRLDGTVKDERTGLNHVFGAGEIVARATLSASPALADDSNSRPPLRGPNYLKVAAKHPDAKELLTLFGLPEPPDWSLLYKIYEIIADNLGGDAGLKAQSWVHVRELRAFTASANRPDVSGDAARHSRTPGPPPRRTMTLYEARGFIARLTQAWLDSLPA